MKKISVTAIAAMLAVSAFAQDTAPQQHLKFYGFVRTYFAFDTRESSAGTEDLYFYMPKDVKKNDAGEDVNGIPSFRYAALTSRLGLDILGYEVADYKIGGKIEADFYAGVTGVTGTAQFRLRQAFVTVAKNGRNWKVGQAWHPMAADLPDIFSLESGAPFGPFSRTPQVAFNCGITEGLSFNAAALWQMQYTSTGPDGAKADYIRYGLVPELFAGFTYKWKDASVLKFGADVLSIKPRQFTAAGNRTKERITTANLFVYGQTRVGNVDLKTKVTFANDGSHFNMVGGYGVSNVNADGTWDYRATRNLSCWATAAYKKKDCRWVPSIFLGYVRNFGTGADMVDGTKMFWCKNSASDLCRMWRVQPEILYNLGKLAFGLEYMMTGVEYGKAGKLGFAESNLHVVANHRIQALVKYTF